MTIFDGDTEIGWIELRAIRVVRTGEAPTSFREQWEAMTMAMLRDPECTEAKRFSSRETAIGWLLSQSRADEDARMNAEPKSNIGPTIVTPCAEVTWVADGGWSNRKTVENGMGAEVTA